MSHGEISDLDHIRELENNEYVTLWRTQFLVTQEEIMTFSGHILLREQVIYADDAETESGSEDSEEGFEE